MVTKQSFTTKQKLLDVDSAPADAPAPFMERTAYEFTKPSNRKEHYAKVLKKRRQILADSEAPDHVLYFTAPSRTDPDLAPSCDVNLIIERYRTTRQLPLVREMLGKHDVDLVDAPTYEAGLNAIAYANDLFSRLPSDIRSKFGNNPAEFLRAYDDPSQAAWLASLGIINPPSGTTPPDTTNEAPDASSTPSEA